MTCEMASYDKFEGLELKGGVSGGVKNLIYLNILIIAELNNEYNCNVYS